jgi:hypothetical protein
MKTRRRRYRATRKNRGVHIVSGHGIGFELPPFHASPEKRLNNPLIRVSPAY